jgi:hypothetical protein
MTAEQRGDTDESRLLAIYLRDHWAGSTAGLALAERCRRNNAGTDYEATLADVEREIREDREELRAIMNRLGVTPSRIKAALGAVAEAFARLKANGRIAAYSPSSRVVELETLAAGVSTKGHLWRTLRVSTPRGHVTSSETELDELEQRTANQLFRLMELHERATAEAFGTARTA